MTANVNTQTGINYGVVSLNSLADWVWDEFFNNGKNLSYEAAWKENLALNNMKEGDCGYEELQTTFNDGYQGDEESYELETEGMKLGLSYLGGGALVWVFESPHTSNCRPCSPCCPNAGDLNNKGMGGHIKAYDVPPEWYANFEEEQTNNGYDRLTR